MVKRFVMGVGVGEGRIGRFLITCMAIGFLALIAAGVAAAWSTLRGEEHTRSVNHTYEVELAIDRARIGIEQSETTRRGFLLTGQRLYLDTYRTGMASLPERLADIARLTQDNPRQRANIASLRAQVAELEQARARSIALMLAGNRFGALTLFDGETSAKRMRAIRDVSDAMAREEERLLAIRDRQQQESVRTFYITLGVAGLLLVLVAAISLATVLRYTRDLADSRDVLRDFADTLEEQVRERTGDLIRANEEIQRFAYIVSHDLRSPLVNVMGFTAELEDATQAIRGLIDRAEEVAPAIVTDEARHAAREDLPEAIGFIRKSTQKMDRLINAILKLAREGRRVLAPQPIDLAAMIETIGASLTQQIDGRGAELVIERPLPALVSDRLAIEQILSNLIENAVKYLDPARAGRIVVRGHRDGVRVVIEVADNGRGIAAADHARVFDLFRRSGNQDQPGEGIGLAHVRALAYRLGGVIDVRSELGAGATFRLILPGILIEQGTREGQGTT